MPTSYPGAIDSFTNPTDTDTLADPSHSDQHTDANDAIEAIERRVGASGTSFPGSPSAGDRFYRTDDKIEYEYDGTRWLCICPHFVQLGYRTQLPNGLTATDSALYQSPHPVPGKAIYVTFLGITHTVAPSDGSNYWGFALRRFVGNTGSFVDSFLSQGDSGSVWTPHTGSTGPNVVPATNEWFRGELSSKTGSPGASSSQLGFAYRIIGA